MLLKIIFGVGALRAASGAASIAVYPLHVCCRGCARRTDEGKPPIRLTCQGVCYIVYQHRRYDSMGTIVVRARMTVSALGGLRLGGGRGRRLDRPYRPEPANLTWYNLAISFCPAAKSFGLVQVRYHCLTIMTSLYTRTQCSRRAA